MSDEQKTIYILIGPKGSGKTYIGTVLEQHFSIRFLRVEALLINHCKDHEVDINALEKHGFPIEEEVLDQVLSKADKVIFEATGSSVHFQEHLTNLSAKYKLKLIRVISPLDVCYARAKSRDQSAQIPVSEELFKKINERAIQARFAFDLEIDNSQDLATEDIVGAFSRLLTRG